MACAHALRFHCALTGELLGCLIVGADISDAFQPEHTRIMQEVANLLAVALQQTRLRKSEQQRRR